MPIAYSHAGPSVLVKLDYRNDPRGPYLGGIVGLNNGPRVGRDGTPIVAHVSAAGEVTGVEVPTIPRKRKARAKVSFLMIEQSAAIKIPRSLNQTEQSVLNHMLTMYSLEHGYSFTTVTDTAHALGLNPANTHRAVRGLIKRGFLYRISARAWVVNPHYGFRGDTDDWVELLRKYAEPEWK